MANENGSSSIVLASSMKELESLATRIAKSNLVPTSYRDKPDDIYVAMLMGNELGVGPMQAIQNIDVVEGRARSRSRLKKVLALRNPNCEYFTMIEATPQKATFETKRRNNPGPTRFTYTIEMAQAAGLTRKANWVAHATSMLIARCEGMLADIEYGDSTLGIPADEHEYLEESVIAEPVKASAGVVVDVTPPAPTVANGSAALKATLEKKKAEAAANVQDVELKETKPAANVKAEEQPATTETKNGVFTVEKNEDGSETLKREKKSKVAAPATTPPATTAAPVAANSTPPAAPSDEAYEKCLALAKLRSIPADVLKAKLKEVGAKGPKSVTEEHYAAIAKMYPADVVAREPGDEQEPPVKDGDLF